VHEAPLSVEREPEVLPGPRHGEQDLVERLRRVIDGNAVERVELPVERSLGAADRPVVRLAPVTPAGERGRGHLDPALELPPVERFTLDNGLRVVVHEDRRVPKVAVSVWYHVGSMNEPRGRSGFAHLFEHLMFNGSENHDSDYFPPLQEIGASAVNGATSLDQTFYYQVVPTGGLERVLWLESDRMGHLLGAITQAKLDEQRAVVQNEKRTRENQPYGLVPQFRMAGLFPEGHPYHHPTIGSMEDLDAATLEDARAWFAQYYGAANAVITVAGDVTTDEVRRLVTRYFGSIAAGPPTSRVTRWVPELAEDRRETMLDEVPQAMISRSWAVPGRGTDEASALRMAARVLGRGRTSRLHRRLVQELQVATDASANYESYAVAGVFSIDVRLKQDADPAAAEAEVAALLHNFLEEGPTPGELERAKIGSHADTARAMEAIYVRAMALSDGAIFAGDPGGYAEEERRFNATTADQVRTVGAQWLRRGSYQLTVLPYGGYASAPDTADLSWDDEAYEGCRRWFEAHQYPEDLGWESAQRLEVEDEGNHRREKPDANPEENYLRA
jgi:zinc protease